MRLIEMITYGNTYIEMKNNFLSIYLRGSHRVLSSWKQLYWKLQTSKKNNDEVWKK